MGPSELIQGPQTIKASEEILGQEDLEEGAEGGGGDQEQGSRDAIFGKCRLLLTELRVLVDAEMPKMWNKEEYWKKKYGYKK